ncbi:hypothetical protein K492DRAFT_235920 [Lichtheimia hyalospora FSU 10163]|nr:hypothetical protein K492DRAFT_235920 [Lichtheimia hyalospora FSU 10163]
MNRNITLLRKLNAASPRRFLTSSSPGLDGQRPAVSVPPGTPPHHQQNNDAGIMEHAPRWKEEVASDSEACVKADHEPEEDLNKLKNKSVEWMKKHGHEDKEDKDLMWNKQK